jgi:hypothetical protein
MYVLLNSSHFQNGRLNCAPYTLTVTSRVANDDQWLRGVGGPGNTHVPSTISLLGSYMRTL